MWMDASDLVYSADSLERMMGKAERELRRPLASIPPWLRCTCAILATAQFSRALCQSMALSAAGAALACGSARQGTPKDAACAAHAAWRSAWLGVRAAWGIARAGWIGVCAGREMWATPTANISSLALLA